MRIDSKIRWLLLPCAVLLSFYLCVATAIGVFIVAEMFCPTELLIADSCTAKYMDWTKEILLHLTPAAAATLMVYTAAYCAPKHKFKAAMLTFILGSCAAFYYAWDSSYWLAMAIAEVSPIAMLFWLSKHG